MQTPTPLVPPEMLAADATFDRAQRRSVLAWWQTTDFIRVSGADAAQFLDGIATQDCAGIPSGQSRYCLFLTNKARIIAPVLAYRESETCFLLEMDPRLIETALQHLRKYVLRAKVEIEAMDLATVSLLGPDSSDVAGQPNWYNSHAWGVPAQTCIGAPEAIADTVQLLTNAGVEYADPEALDALRITSGTPSLADMQPGFMPAEVGAMEYAVALDKGCYLGQEPVARLHYRGRANRTLRTVSLSHELPDSYFANTAPDDDRYLALVAHTDAPDDSDARTLGTLTSWACSPDGTLVGMAILRREISTADALCVAGTDVVVTARSTPDDSA